MSSALPTLNLQALTGQVQLRAGAGLPAIHNSRPLLAELLAPGRAADELPGLLASLYTLCAHAHRLCAQQAVAAARGEAPAFSTAQAQALQESTLREQILRISHDWPRQLSRVASGSDAPVDDPAQASAHSALLLRSCPLWREGLNTAERLAELPVWLAHQWLGEPVQPWLARHEAQPLQAAAQWALQRGQASPVARLLGHELRASPSPASLAVPGLYLDVLDQPQQLPVLARAMAEQPAFCAQPTWLGLPASTGPWSRRNDPLRSAQAQPTAWTLLLARVVEVLRLSGPQGAQWLSQGALPLGPHEGLAWCETARGLLLHWVRLQADDEQVQAYRVLAPTEWNFHPQGALALALARLDPQAPAAELLAGSRRLAVAFDPCVDFEVLLPHTATLNPDEASHA